MPCPVNGSLLHRATYQYLACTQPKFLRHLRKGVVFTHREMHVREGRRKADPPGSPGSSEGERVGVMAAIPRCRGPLPDQDMGPTGAVHHMPENEWVSITPKEDPERQVRRVSGIEEACYKGEGRQRGHIMDRRATTITRDNGVAEGS